MATAEIPTYRDAALAIQLAKKGVESNPQSSSYHNTLGVARYRAGDWKQAIAELEKSIALGKGDNSHDYLFLAISHWKLGNKDEARQWYVRAVPWMDVPMNAELRRFRAEAEDLLGVKEPADHLLRRNAVYLFGIDAHEILAATRDDVGLVAVCAQGF